VAADETLVAGAGALTIIVAIGLNYKITQPR
jgi:hypothetical protein